MRRHARLARYAAPAAFLLAATIAILLVRAGLSNERDDADDADGRRRPRSRTPTGTTTGDRDDRPTVPAGAEFYEIEPGDTLAVIADQYDTTVEQLLVLNPDSIPSR